ncbi:hypothetical protein LCGC14_2904050 [marine sediment metagenome]|uniref:Uncharacterized protein n=1 Tax=marine sediment metagenome TaxID=412755 RepID=A0A0F8XTL1_9ZZZZ
MKKNIQIAIEITDGLIKAHIKNSQGIRDLINDWNSDTKELGLSIASVHEDVAKCLLVIKKYLEEKPKCRHPKKMRDKCKGQIYCMQCNTDLDEK